MNTANQTSSIFEQIAGWWNLLGWDAQIFYAIGAVALAIVVIQAVLTLVGIGELGAGVPDDVSVGDTPHDVGLGLISVRSLTAFFMGFGLTGGMLLDAGKPLWWAVGGGIFVGAVFMSVIFWIMKMLYGLRSSGNVDPATAKGSTGTVYVEIQSNKTSGGQIEVLVSGRVMTFPAITKSAEKIPAGALVRITEILPSNIFIVEAEK